MSSSVRSPLPSTRIFVVVTLDAERYTPVDLTDILDHGPVIRTRILTKLGICRADEQASALIFQTEIGALPSGKPLGDDLLSSICHERGDSRASLAFIVQQAPVPAPPYSSPLPVSSKERRRRNRSHTINQLVSSVPSSTANRLSLQKSVVLRSPSTCLAEIPSKGHGSPYFDELHLRRIRPLPTIPTPTSASGFVHSKNDSLPMQQRIE
ncbi:hypothetical protein H0H81_000180 [Sphagnurus paluster]|uniref:Uncharacterized protein n=1 Tax=Sphagnurus paluster TaxID=117069 RepID=A0A9P7FXY9_9AGAR|nr:hypothetical protein H0H81_000180 [Sphagnurus paluster]